jgi:type IV pilus assembly protein PilE
MKNGFSLIELLCVLGLIGLLSTLAYPSYTKHLVRARRLEAISALLDLATRLEQHHLHQNTYQNMIYPPTTPSGYYQLHITQATKTAYQLEATALNKQDTQCTHLTLDSQGHEGENSACWQV